MQVTICAANCVGQAGNCSYPNRVTVVTPEQLQEAVKKDHVCAEFKGIVSECGILAGTEPPPSFR